MKFEHIQAPIHDQSQANSLSDDYSFELYVTVTECCRSVCRYVTDDDVRPVTVTVTGCCRTVCRYITMTYDQQL